jgi:hypothetical protein
MKKFKRIIPKKFNCSDNKSNSLRDRFSPEVLEMLHEVLTDTSKQLSLYPIVGADIVLHFASRGPVWLF